MNLTTQKVELIKMLIATSDAALLKDVKKLLEHAKGSGKEISPAKIASIKRGLEDIEKGNIFSHSEVRKIYEKWL